MLLNGQGDVVFINGGPDDITDHGSSLKVQISKAGGVVNLHDFLTDKHSVVDLLGGVGGYKTVRSIVTALQSDGNGGTLLSLGSAGHIDFVAAPITKLTATHFQIG
jgi:hypothetical protein